MLAVSAAEVGHAVPAGPDRNKAKFIQPGGVQESVGERQATNSQPALRPSPSSGIEFDVGLPQNVGHGSERDDIMGGEVYQAGPVRALDRIDGEAGEIVMMDELNNISSALDPNNDGSCKAALAYPGRFAVQNVCRPYQ
ncbi:MAG: hypothetical protein JOZ49_00110 [Mycolicibacterium sp.]|nr:hypothetical protein [Mycolicibacterium sp.]